MAAMNIAAAAADRENPDRIPAPANGRADSSACFHCGLPLPGDREYRVVVDGEPRALCCAGCEAVAQTIVDNGLTSYYRHRSALPAGAQLVPDAVREAAVYAIDDVATAVERPVARDSGGDRREASLMLEGITCAACVWLIEQRVSRIAGVESIDINFASHRARVRWDARCTRLAQILNAIALLGYRAYPYDRERAEHGRNRERDQALRRLFVAGFGMMQVMMYLVPVYLTQGEMTPDIEQLMRIASLILTLPVVFYSALPFFAGAWRDLRARHTGMDVPVALGIGAAFVASVAATLAGHGDVYFDSVTMFVFLLLAARYLEMTARLRAMSTQEELARQAPVVAEQLTSWPASRVSRTIAAAQLRVGDYVFVRPGAAVPADGVVVDGRSDLDERLLTGEARPRMRKQGDALTGGAMNVGNPLVMRVTRIGSDTILAGILRLLERAAGDRPQVARSADRVARAFVPALLVIAAIVAACWMQIDPARAFAVTIAVLVVSCPCALSLATPAALASASAALHARGVLVTRGDAVENLARATDVVFDKTGTLTEGRLTLAGVRVLQSRAGLRTRDACLALAAELEAGSGHPIARALVAAAPAAMSGRRSDCTNVAGSGVEATLNATKVRIGTPDFVAALAGNAPTGELETLPDDVTVVGLGDSQGWIALFTFADPIRIHARSLVAGLTAMGKRVHLVSGDRIQIARHVARALDISNVSGNVAPAEKVSYVRALQRTGAVVAMVGDGVNDAAALGVAQVSVAVNGSADVACGASDIILLADRIEVLLDAANTARMTLAIIRQNLAWAFAYNVVAIPLAACGYMSPLLAGIGMAASSMLVAANALRLARGPANAAAIAPTAAVLSES